MISRKVLFIALGKERGQGYWKFNTSLLHSDDYVKLVKDILLETKLEYSKGPLRENGIDNILDKDLRLSITDSLFLELY